jgi:hypothetical protein
MDKFVIVIENLIQTDLNGKNAFIGQGTKTTQGTF